MLTYPHINPIALKIGPLAIHWYGIMYLIGFGSAWILALKRIKSVNRDWTANEVSDLIFYCGLGVLIGGRLGYMLFYAFPTLIHDPLSIFKIWDGGMSSHGGFIGVAVSVLCFAHRTGKAAFAVSDFLMPLVPIGLGAGRLGNFINGELWGRVTDVPWAMIFPNAGPLPRHPSMLYEMTLEGILLFVIVWIYSSRPRPVKSVTGLFFFTYGLFRIFIECFRQPDAQLGFIAFNWLTMGQLLSVPLVLIGAYLMYLSSKRKSRVD